MPSINFNNSIKFYINDGEIVESKILDAFRFLDDINISDEDFFTLFTKGTVKLTNCNENYKNKIISFTKNNIDYLQKLFVYFFHKKS